LLRENAGAENFEVPAVKNNIVEFRTTPTSIDPQLRSAIANKRLIEFTYNDTPRIAEPHDYGQRRGIDQLLVYQRKKAGEYKTGWRSLEVKKIQNLVLLEETFRGTRRRPEQDHVVWDVLYARVD
jgi:hypothetical protein